MLAYPIIEGRTVLERTDFENMEVGRTYSILGIVHKEDFRGDEHHYIYELHVAGVEHSFATNQEGNKPFAVWTRDSKTDAFSPLQLAKVIVHEGYYFIYSHRKGVANPEDIETLVFQITSLNPEDPFKLGSVEFKLVNRFNSSETKPYFKFVTAMKHTARLFDSHEIEYLKSKYCFNPSRITSQRVFIRNHGSNFISKLDTGQTLIINKKTDLYRKERQREGPEIVVGRCFYSKKYTKNNIVLVDGYPLDVLKEYELDDYLAKSGVTEEQAKIHLKKVYFSEEDYLFCMLTSNGKIRPIYKMTGEYLSFQLNDFEMQAIQWIEPAKRIEE